MSAPATPTGRGPLRRSLGVGLVSVGWMGRLHAQAYRRLLLHYPELGLAPRLVVAADIVPERQRFAKDELGFAEVTADWQRVVAHPAVEAVSITVPNYLHREVALAAAAHGKHFWIEKPVGRDAGETAAIAAAAAAADRRTAVGFNYRQAPAVQRARELVRSGELGQVTHVRGVFLNDYAAEPRGALSWRFQRDLAGSGATGDLFSHALDLLQFVVAPVREVAALTATVITERPLVPMGQGTHFAVVEGGELAAVENEDYVGALLRFDGGAVGTCEASRITVGPRCQVGFDVHATDGSVSWDFERMNELLVCRGRSGADHGYTRVLAGPEYGDYARFQPGPGISMSYDDLKVIEAALFVRSIETGQQHGAGVEDALRTARVLAAVERAGRSGHFEQVAVAKDG